MSPERAGEHDQVLERRFGVGSDEALHVFVSAAGSDLYWGLCFCVGTAPPRLDAVGGVPCPFRETTSSLPLLKLSV